MKTESKQFVSHSAWHYLARCPVFCNVSAFILKNTQSSPLAFLKNRPLQQKQTNHCISAAENLSSIREVGLLTNFKAGYGHLPVNILK